MKIFFLFFLGLCVMSFVPSVMAAEDVTLTTYYPSPLGVYHELRADVHKYSPQAVEPLWIADAGGCVPGNSNTIGATYFGNNGGIESFWVCGNNGWKPLYLPPQPEVYLGGYYMMPMPCVYGSSADPIALHGSGNKAMGVPNAAWMFYFGDSPYTGRSQLWPTDTTWGPIGSAVQVDFIGLSRGNYAIDWSATLDVDQFTGTSPKAARLAVQAFTYYGWVTMDSSDNFTDNKNISAGSADFSDTTLYSSNPVDKTFTLYYSSFNMTNHLYRRYRIIVYKADSDGVMTVRVSDGSLKIRRLEG